MTGADDKMASRASSASEGEVFEKQHKANTLSHSRESAIDDSDRVFGLDGTSDVYGKRLKKREGCKLTFQGHDYRALSRSPSPYRRKPSRSPSPYRRNRDRSPSPYRRNRNRSPSPYRHSRGNRGHDGHDSRSSHNKRKASPQRHNRPDKRYHADGSRHHDRRQKSQYDDPRVGPRQSGSNKDGNASDRRYPPPISYADNELPNPVPGFHDVRRSLNNGRHNGRQHDDNGHRSRLNASDFTKPANDAKSSRTTDVEM